MSSITSSLYHQCSIAEEDSPRYNIHKLHQILMGKHSHLLDSRFLKQLQGNEFHPRRFELYVPELLLNANRCTIETSPKAHEPDWLIKCSGISFYLEAVCPDSLPAPKDFSSVLRKIRKSLQKKKDKHTKWVFDDVISTTIPYVIFIGLYGMDSVFIPLNNLMTSLLKFLGEIFNETEYVHISAVIISNACDQRAMTYGEMQLLNDMILIHNSKAVNPLSPGTIKTVGEHYA